VLVFVDDDDAEDNEGEESELVTTDADRRNSPRSDYNHWRRHNKNKGNRYYWYDDAAEDNEEKEFEFVTTDADRRYSPRSDYNHWRRHNKNKGNRYYWYDDDAAEDNKNEMVQLRGAVKAQI
jgi:hypothetical protein